MKKLFSTAAARRIYISSRTSSPNAGSVHLSRLNPYPPNITTTTQTTRRINTQNSKEYRKSPQEQAHPLTGYYKILLENPQTPSAHPAYYPSQSIARQDQTNSAHQRQQEERARLVFGSKLVGPLRREKLNERAQIVAGVRVPPKPEEPDNCCMSGCVNCVWDTFREDLEEWAVANAKAQKALREQDPRTASRKLELEKKGASPTPPIGSRLSDGMESDGGRTAVGINMWEGLEDIPVGIRVFMDTEKEIKSRRKVLG
ncbi:hypothetical protein ABW19_dt0202317 [Dactylella cylindrospora]|nr:hypothetical protein ABW19_dt0202317 [Dactylella cylindrospora]